jgi:hypothetical protein
VTGLNKKIGERKPGEFKVMAKDLMEEEMKPKNLG